MSTRRREIVFEAAGDLASIGTAPVPFFGGSLSAFLQAIENRHLQAEIRMLHEITGSLGKRIDDIEASLAEGEELVDLAAHAVRVAPELRSDELIEGVANIVALAFVTEPPQVELAHLLIDIAGRLSPEHLAVLRAVSRVLRDSYERSDRNTNKPWPTRTIVEELPNLASVMDPLIGQLEALGTVRQMESVTAVRAQAGPFEGGWVLTNFGVQLLNHLDGEG